MFSVVVLLSIQLLIVLMSTIADLLPRLGQRELIFSAIDYAVSVQRCFILVLRMGCDISL